MTAPSPRVLRRSALAAGCAGFVIVAGSFAPALASTVHHSKPAKPVPQKLVVTGSRYLALGDSVPFGYRESNSIPAPNDHKPKTMIGYPEDVAANLGLKLANAACPGETTGSFLKATAQSNGCENSYTKGQPPDPSGGYRTNFPLHVKYASKSESQLTYAEKYLKKYPDTRLVTLLIGANDGFICQKKYTDGCVSELGALKASLTKNATKIFKGLRNTAHYTGQIVLLTYYSFDYTNPILNYEVQQISGAIAAGAKGYHVETADGYGAYQQAARQGKNNPCTAQLLTALSGADAGTCGVHPSLSGAAVLGQAIERAIKK